MRKTVKITVACGRTFDNIGKSSLLDQSSKDIAIKNCNNHRYFMKNNAAIPATSPLPMSGHGYILDDGTVDGHGYFLPKQAAGGLKSVCNSGVQVDDVPLHTLRGALSLLSACQKERLSLAAIE